MCVFNWISQWNFHSFNIWNLSNIFLLLNGERSFQSYYKYAFSKSLQVYLKLVICTVNYSSALRFILSVTLWQTFGFCLLWTSPTFASIFSRSLLSILLMLAYMGTVIGILLNILIAQMSTTFTQAKKVARLEYDVDRILQLTRMERFPFSVCYW